MQFMTRPALAPPKAAKSGHLVAEPHAELSELALIPSVSQSFPLLKLFLSITLAF
jgi:hypothetical protein